MARNNKDKTDSKLPVNKRTDVIVAIILVSICFLGVMLKVMPNIINRAIIESSTGLKLHPNIVITNCSFSFPHFDSTKPSGVAFDPFSAVLDGNIEDFNNIMSQIGERAINPPRSPDPQDPYEFCERYNYHVGYKKNIAEIHVFVSRTSIFPHTDFVLILYKDDRFKMRIYSK